MAVLQDFSATDLATRHIRDQIMRDVLRPGVKLRIDDLAAELGVSRTPVRDALTRLQNEGLVKIVSRVGVYVRDISAREVLEVYTVKELLEPLMAQWATERSTDEERAAYADSAKPLPELAAREDPAEYIELIAQRRSRMLELSRSVVISSVFRPIDGRVRVLRTRNLASFERRDKSSKDHMAIAEAVRAGNAQLAAELTGEHVRSARESLIKLIDREGSDRSDSA